MTTRRGDERTFLHSGHKKANGVQPVHYCRICNSVARNATFIAFFAGPIFCGANKEAAMSTFETPASRRSALGALVVGALGGSLPASTSASATQPKPQENSLPQVQYKRQQVGEVDVFYREAGPADAPVLLLLHGFPSASHMFRDLIPHLAGRYRVIAPDMPGFGQTKAPPRGQFEYGFDNLAKVMDGFVNAIGLERYALYIFDYGAPVGLRLAMSRPERVSAIISQNGNAYLEGFSDEWGAWQTYWRDPSSANREACRATLSAETIKGWHYAPGSDPALLSPDGYELDIAYMVRPGAEEIQLDLILDYRSNVALYPDFQAYFRAHRPPLLAVWGRHDRAFVPAGAEAYRRDLPDAEIHLLDAGHFALETRHGEIGSYIQDFLGRQLTR